MCVYMVVSGRPSYGVRIASYQGSPPCTSKAGRGWCACWMWLPVDFAHVRDSIARGTVHVC